MSEILNDKKQTAYADTMEALRQTESALPDFSSSYDGEISRLYEKITNRPAFQYDPTGDPLYRSYRAEMLNAGSRAMRDSEGQAAALTGGYGSSYAQSVGQQQYGLYLQKLGQAMPELYQAAYERYRAQGEELQGQLNTAKSLADSEYGRKKDRFTLASGLEKQGYERGEKRYQKLMDLISQSGYEPSDEELSVAGMKREQAEALRMDYWKDYFKNNPLALLLYGAR